MTLTCDVNGHPVPSIQWKKNGTEISRETKRDLVMVLDYTQDDGEYSCVASNDHGTKESETETVYVKC